MHRRPFLFAVVTAALPLITACSLGLTDVPDPSTIIDPSLVQTEKGAVGLYSEALTKFNRIHSGSYGGGDGSSFVLATGLASDEFSSARPVMSAFSLRRVGPGGLPTPGASAGEAEQPYFELHAARLTIDQSIGALKQFAPNAPSSYIAQLYALRGYLSVMFAELYCSGVPFSRAVYGGDLVTGRPLSTEAMLQQAIADFDSSLAISTDSVRIRQMAFVGKARALLNMNQPAQAAVVASTTNVPDNFQYAMMYNAQTFPNYGFLWTSPDAYSVDAFMADRLGTNGLEYRTAGNPDNPAVDPRVQWAPTGGFPPVSYPAKYSNGSTPVVLADGLEARLIEAEAKLRAEDYAGWAGALNALRRTRATSVIPDLPADSTVNASPTLRVAVMFRERAFWLYGTGHRLGDMRRMVRQYGRPTTAVFPVGTNTDLYAPDNLFSAFPNFSPPLAEINGNPNYSTGCFNRDA